MLRERMNLRTNWTFDILPQCCDGTPLQSSVRPLARLSSLCYQRSMLMCMVESQEGSFSTISCTVQS